MRFAGSAGDFVLFIGGKVAQYFSNFLSNPNTKRALPIIVHYFFAEGLNTWIVSHKPYLHYSK